MRYHRLILLSSVLLGGLLPWPCVCQANEVSEAEIKAVFVYNFASFVRWPSDIADSGNFSVCALGEDEVTRLLPKVVDGEAVGDEVLRFHPKTASDDLRTCRILYIASVDQPLVENILVALQGTSVLTVSSQEGFAQRGGAIELGRKGRNVHPVINKTTIRDARLRVSAPLMRLATVIEVEAR
ncbi:MAG: YfiR family protein [Chromatiales bacterium]|nr:YfiR family protein [Chromatiales bacterium]